MRLAPTLHLTSIKINSFAGHTPPFPHDGASRSPPQLLITEIELNIDLGDLHYRKFEKIIMGAEKSPTCLQPNKKNPGKAPKRVHKAEREKLKRERLNDLFLELATALELSEQNSGKASVLGETTRVVKDMLDQIKSLKKENVALLSESQYIMVEKNELKDETSSLQNQISELKSIIKDRSVQTSLDLNAPAIESQEPHYFPQEIIRLPSGDPLMNPVFVIPTSHSVQVHPQPDSSRVIGNKPVSNVSKPNPRYPTPSDSWPFKLLEKQSQEGTEDQQRGRV